MQKCGYLQHESVIPKFTHYMYLQAVYACLLITLDMFLL